MHVITLHTARNFSVLGGTSVIRIRLRLNLLSLLLCTFGWRLRLIEPCQFRLASCLLLGFSFLFAFVDGLDSQTV